jgi:hypothetical protein
MATIAVATMGSSGPDVDAAPTDEPIPTTMPR